MDKDHPNYRETERIEPLNYDEASMPGQMQALFKRDVLIPLYERFKKYGSTSVNPSAESFLYFLLSQVKDDRDYAIRKGQTLERIKSEFHKRFKQNTVYIWCVELLMRDVDPYEVIERLIEMNDNLFKKLQELNELMPPFTKPKL